MNAERLKEILDDTDAAITWSGDNVFKGLVILAKYISPERKDLITGASHDQLWSVGLDEICEAGITEDDARALALLNWMEEDGSLSCFV